MAQTEAVGDSGTVLGANVCRSYLSRERDGYFAYLRNLDSWEAGSG